MWIYTSTLSIRLHGNIDTEVGPTQNDVQELALIGNRVKKEDRLCHNYIVAIIIACVGDYYCCFCFSCCFVVIVVKF
jgi:hypothetical protein